MGKWVVEGKVEKGWLSRTIDNIRGIKNPVDVTLTRGKEGDHNHAVIRAFDNHIFPSGVELIVFTSTQMEDKEVMKVIKGCGVDGNHYMYTINSITYKHGQI